MYEQSFIENFEQTYVRNMKKEQEIRSKEKEQLRKQLDQSQKKLSKVISKTNEILAINFKGEDDVEGWLQEFKKNTDKYTQEMNSIIPDRIRSRNSYFLNMAQLQKEKIASSRFQVRKLTEMNKHD